ncbi:hypothetical protein [Streptomyces sp. NPDC049555]|uniref:hypothetical protein n=1 Tax=Streptomyces sp. NPDC049555 TaxID=3154930 RepID=UPI0034396515
MGKVSAIPENLLTYSGVCTGAAEELQAWVRAVLAPALRAYEKGGGVCNPLDGRALQHLTAAHETDRYVRSVGLAFQETQRGAGPGEPSKPVTATEQALDSALQRLQRNASPTPSPQPGLAPPSDPAHLSYELWGANLLPRPGRLRPDGTPFSREEDAVLSWIEAHRETILREARKWNISPQAIVAAISWEAIENPQPFRHPIPAGTGLGRIHQRLARWATGPGKVHTDFPLVKQVEDRGYMPRTGLAHRESLLSSDEGSIRYIAAIMGAFADVTDRDGRFGIRYDVPMLTQLFQGSDLEKWERRLLQMRQTGTTRLEPGNDMALWAKSHPDFLNAAIPLRPWATDPVPSTPSPEPSTPVPTPGSSPTPN